MATSEAASVVVIDYAELLADTTSEDLRKKIEQGYGYEGLGIVVIRGVPGFGPKREAALPQAYKFGHLPGSSRGARPNRRVRSRGYPFRYAPSATVHLHITPPRVPLQRR